MLRRIILLAAFIFGFESQCLGFSVALFYPLQFPLVWPDGYLLRMSIIEGQLRNMYGLDLSFIGNRTSQQFVGSSFSPLYHVNNNALIVGGQVSLLGLNYNKGQSTIIGGQFASINVNSGPSTTIGFQTAWLGNYSPNSLVIGAQLSPVYSYSEKVAGYQIAGIAHAKNNFIAQYGLVTFSEAVYGAQEGAITYSDLVYGAQVGMFCIAKDMYGFQFGYFSGADTFVGLQSSMFLTANSEIKGVQASMINFSGKVKGLQIGYINIAGQLEGIQLGLVNIAGNALIPIMPGFNMAF